MDYNESKRIAGLHYQPSMRDTQNQDEVHRGFQETHDLLSGYYTDGTVDNLIEKESGNDLP